jgi:chromosome segregation ATPase
MGREDDVCCDLREFRTEVRFRQDAQDKAIDDVKKQVSGLENKMTGLEIRLTGLETKMVGLETKLTETVTRIQDWTGTIKESLNELKEDRKNTDARLSALEKGLARITWIGGPVAAVIGAAAIKYFVG